MRSSKIRRYLFPGWTKESCSRSNEIPCMNSTGGHTVALLVSHRGCHRLKSHTVLSGRGKMCCNNKFTMYILPNEVGFETLAVKGCWNKNSCWRCCCSCCCCCCWCCCHSVCLCLTWRFRLRGQTYALEHWLYKCWTFGNLSPHNVHDRYIPFYRRDLVGDWFITLYISIHHSIP